MGSNGDERRARIPLGVVAGVVDALKDPLALSFIRKMCFAREMGNSTLSGGRDPLVAAGVVSQADGVVAVEDFITMREYRPPLETAVKSAFDDMAERGTAVVRDESYEHRRETFVGGVKISSMLRPGGGVPQPPP